jgi:hypothetical protein
MDQAGKLTQREPDPIQKEPELEEGKQADAENPETEAADSGSRDPRGEVGAPKRRDEAGEQADLTQA